MKTKALILKVVINQTYRENCALLNSVKNLMK